MTGLEMMIAPVLKSLGIKPEQIGELATAMQEGIGLIPAILNNQRAIMEALNIAEKFDGGRNGNHGDGGGSPGTGGNGV